MITDGTIDIDAPPELVWEVFSAVEAWPSWTPSVTRLVALDGPELALGRRFQLDQPRMPRLVWEVTELTAGRSWTWAQRSPGGTTLASHLLTPLRAGSTRVDQRIDQRGPVGTLVGVAMRRTTRRYLDEEATGLRDRCEALHRGAPTA